jgi:hypothetical protein
MGASTRSLLIGADPELFVRDKNTKKYIVTPKMPGSKQKPFPVEDGAIQVDGCALEFNIKPAHNKKEFVSNIERMLGGLKSKLAELYPDAELVAVPFVEFEDKYFKKVPAFMKQLGCEPDWCAYTEALRVMPEIKTAIRSAGGHIHVGFTKDVPDPTSLHHMELCSLAVQQLDCSVFLPSVYFDKDIRRQQLYGGPGAWRPKSYGFEYRAPSNTWVHKRELIEWMYDSIITTMHLITKGFFLTDEGLLKGAVQFARNNPRGYAEAKPLHRNVHDCLLDYGMPQIPMAYIKSHAA